MPSVPPAFGIATCATTSPSCWAAIPTPTRPGAMTYDLRRLRLHGLIERVPRSHRYRITPLGASVAMLYVRLYARALRPAVLAAARRARPAAQHAFDRLDAALANFLQEVQLAA